MEGLKTATLMKNTLLSAMHLSLLGSLFTDTSRTQATAILNKSLLFSKKIGSLTLQIKVQEQLYRVEEVDDTKVELDRVSRALDVEKIEANRMLDELLR